jgi:hypothetical protein
MMRMDPTPQNSAASAPAENGTQMQATPETGEHFNGYTLMVEAYAAIWLILMGWLLLLWRKQASLTERVAGLEAALDRAEKRLTDDAPKKKVAAKAAEF